MEFDKSKVLTVVTADQLKEGQMGWINDCVDYLKSDIKNINPYKVFRANENMPLDDFPFAAEGRGIRRYFYPASEPTYAERQEEWIRKHNLKEGDKVKILRTAKDREDGWCNSWVQPMTDMVGGVFTCVMTSGDGIRLSCGYEWPYFVLEVVKEPTYRPYNNDELNDLVGEVLTSKFSGRRKLVTGRPKQKTQVNLDGKPFTAEILLQYYYRNKTEPCGVKI